MPYEITILRARDGMRLRPPEVGPPLVGQLVMEEWPPTHNSYRRTIRRLELRVRVGSIVRAAVHLTDPVLIATRDGGILVFEGTALETRDGRIHEHRQVWRVRPIATDGAHEKKPLAIADQR